MGEESRRVRGSQPQQDGIMWGKKEEKEGKGIKKTKITQFEIFKAPFLKTDLM